MNFLDLCKDKKVYAVLDADLDGVGARILCEYYIAPICHFIPCNTAKRDMSEVETDLMFQAELVFFVDITPTLELYNQLIEKNIPVYIFDHHESGKQVLGDVPNYEYDLNRCGTKIFYDSITKDQRKKRVIHQFVELVDTYDRWQQNSALWEDAKNLSNVLYGYVNWWAQKEESGTTIYLKFINNQLRKFDKARRFQFTPYEQQLIEKAKQKETKAYQKAISTLSIRNDNENNTYAYFECPSKISFVSNKILNENNTLDYVIGYGTFDKTSTKVSLRSKGSFSVSKIAEKWGGGGHENAAGVELEKDDFISVKNGNLHLL